MELYSLVILILAFARLSHERSTQPCGEPHLDESCINSPDTHESYLMLEQNHAHTNDIEYFKDVHYSDLQFVDKQCAWQTTGNYNSSCPHHYVINRDVNRRPKKLLEAKCNCNKTTPCLNGDLESRCMPVKYYINVLRKNKCEGGVYAYVPAVEAITVGCTCSYPVRDLSRRRYVMHQ